MIRRGNKLAVTCTSCDRPFILTSSIHDEALTHWTARAAKKPANRAAGIPLRFKCPHCEARATIDALAGSDFEQFDATRN